ncbi:hypothetical protein, partial [Escherichia coli]|uniref:hypothetical protein n=1 Tax=Escherichia coli TaxID=562 RepID=UPI001954580B
AMSAPAAPKAGGRDRFLVAENEDSVVAAGAWPTVTAFMSWKSGNAPTAADWFRHSQLFRMLGRELRRVARVVLRLSAGILVNPRRA